MQVKVAMSPASGPRARRLCGILLGNGTSSAGSQAVKVAAVHSPMRSTALTARRGRILGILFSICFVTGLLSHSQ